jgi:hypothetical protein
MSEFTKQLNLNDILTVNKEEYEIVNNINKSHNFRPYTKVSAWYTDTGEILWTRHNIMTIVGGAWLARTMFDIQNGQFSSEVTPTYNNALGLDVNVNTSAGATNPEKVYLFCVGTDGCGRENSQVFQPRYADWINPIWDDTIGGIVPFQYRELDDDLDDNQRTIYFGRKTEDEHIAYYFKAFDSQPVLTQQYTNGDLIDGTVYESAKIREQSVETIVTLNLSITKDDCRDFFIFSDKNLTLNDARINTISLCMAWKYNKTENGKTYTYYQNIRPVTRLNLPNEPLIDLRKSISIAYSVYY